MTGRSWLPSEWLDEMVPATGQSPDDFLWRNSQGVLMLSPCDELERRDALEENNTSMLRPIAPGEEIEFCWHEDRGWRTVTVRKDRSWAINEPFPADTTHVFDSDTEILGDGIDDFMKSFLSDNFYDVQLPADLMVHGYVWSEGIKFRVRVAESGAATFEAVDDPSREGDGK